MIPLSLNPIYFSSSLKPPIFRPSLSNLKSLPDRNVGLYQVSQVTSDFVPTPSYLQKKAGVGVCRVELSHDEPFAAAIGSCMLSSLVLPVAGAPDEDGEDSAIDSTDARFGVMGIISFIPYFNWLSWVFAWLDTGKRRY